MPLLRRIIKQAALHPKRIAVVDDNGTHTYGKILAGTYILASLIRASTQKKNVGLLLPTSGLTSMALLASWLNRRVAIPFNYLLAREELQYVIKHSGIDTLITVDPLLKFIGGPEVIPPGVNIVRIDKETFKGKIPLPLPVIPPRFRDDETAVILYTSGTSGKPKGVELTHGNLWSNIDGAVKHANLNSSETFLGVLPQFHAFGLTILTLCPLLIGAKAVYTARFVPKKLVALIKEHQAAVFIAIPTMYNALLQLKDAKAEDFKSLRIVVSGAEPLPQAVADGMRDKFGLRLLEGYGLTETSPAVTWCAPHKPRDKSVGTALPHVSVIIVDDAGNRLPPGSEGEILIAGRNIMKGYYKDPAQTQSVFTTRQATTAAGKTVTRRYFRTGDMGKFDAEGFLYITGRIKEAMKIGGILTFPRQIEEVLNRHPSVKDSAVIGKRDDMRGEIPVAFVELVEGATFDEKALRAFCGDNLAQYKVPREIRAVEALPRGPTGKILRRQLKAD